MLLASLAAFVAWGYATHWFPAIRFAGHGLVAGVLLAGCSLLAVVVTARVDIGGVVPRRARTGAAFAAPAVWARETAALRARVAYSPAPLYAAMPRLSAALDGLLASILQKNVRSWYAQLGSPKPGQADLSRFPDLVDAAVRRALGQLRDRLLAVDDVVLVLTSRVVPLLTEHFRDFNEAERAVRGRKLNRSVTESDELDLAIAAKYKELRAARLLQAGGVAATPALGLHPGAQLAYADASTRFLQQDYLRRLVGDRLLPQLLPPGFLASRPVAALVREIVACAVLYPVLQLLADPDTWNQLMENYGRTVLQDRSTVRRLRAALDQHASSSAAVLGGSRPGRGGLAHGGGAESASASGAGGSAGAGTAAAFPRLAPGDSERHFERFVRAVRKVNNLSDARRFRSEVASQLKRDSQGQVQQPDQPPPPDQVVYLRRLEMGKRLLDQRVQYLAAGGDSRHGTVNGGSGGGGHDEVANGGAGAGGGGPLDGSGGARSGTPGIGDGSGGGGALGGAMGGAPVVSRLETASLADLLRDAAGLSYFMEYMDRQRLLPLVQFWLVVDGFRNPLEEEDEEEEEDGDSDDSKTVPTSLPPWTEADRLDLAQMDQAYLSRPELHIPAAPRRAVRAFLEAGAAASPEQYYRARRAILRCQTAVLKEMEARHFRAFKKSDLFYKCLAAEEAAQQRRPTRNAQQRMSTPMGMERTPSPAAAAAAAAAAAVSGAGTKAGAANRLLPRLHSTGAGAGGGAGGVAGPSRRTGSVTDLMGSGTTASPTTAATTAVAKQPSHGADDPLFGRRSLDGPRTGSTGPMPANHASASSTNKSSMAPLFGDDDDFFTSPTPAGHARSAVRTGSMSNLSNSTGNLAAAASLAASHAMADSVQSLDRLGGKGGVDDDDEPDEPDTKVVQAVEEALTNIMEDDRRPTTAEDLRASLFGDDGRHSGHSNSPSLRAASPRGSLEQARRGSGLSVGSGPTGSGPMGPAAPSGAAAPSVAHALLLHGEGLKPSLASLGLVSAASRIGVFEDDDLFGDDQAKYLSDDESDMAGSGMLEEREKAERGERGEAETEGADDGVHEASPGDLGLVEAIAALGEDIGRLGAQEAVVDSLLRKAELTNNTAELRILRKSRASLQREMRRKELQRQQYALQETDNSLYGRATVRLTDVQTGREADGKEYAVYVVEVARGGEGGGPAATWTIARRYSAFWALHQRLRGRYPSVRALDFPRRRVVQLNKLQGDFLQKRRAALERYLRALLLLPDVCRSRDLRAFLSQRVIGPQAASAPAADAGFDRHVIARLYDSVADGMEDLLGSIPVLDQLSTAGQNLIAAAASQLQLGAGAANAAGGAGPAPPGTEAAAAEREATATPDDDAPFVTPICDIFLEVFELNRGNNWLRGRAVVVVLHQLLGGTVERRLRDSARALLAEAALVRYADMVRDAAAGARVPRTAAQKSRTRAEAGLMLATLVPDLAGSVVGRVNAQAASRRIFATFNNGRLK